MSWNPLRRLQRNGSKSHIIMQADEVALEKHVSKLDLLENSTKKVHKDAKKYEDLMLELHISEKKAAIDLSNSLLCQEEEKLRHLVEEWLTFISEAYSFDEDLMPSTPHYPEFLRKLLLDYGSPDDTRKTPLFGILIVRRTVTDPLKKFQGIFFDTKGALKKRDQALQDCLKASQKVQKLQDKEKTGTNIVKFEAAQQNLANLEKDYQAQEKLLKSELPLLYEGCIEYFQPSLEALIKSQVEHSGNLAKVFNDSVSCLQDFPVSDVDLKNLQNRLTWQQPPLIVTDELEQRFKAIWTAIAQAQSRVFCSA